MNLAFLASHRGSNMQHVLDACRAGLLRACPCVVVHLVDEEYDHGVIIAQSAVAVLGGDTVETLAARVLEQEHRLLVETLRRIVSDELTLPG